MVNATYSSYDATTHPLIKVEDDWNNLLAHGVRKPYDVMVAKNGSYFEATLGTTGQLLYGGSSDYNGVSGSDADAVVQAALSYLSAGGVVYAKNADYPVSATITIPDQTTLIGEDLKKTCFIPSADVNVFEVVGAVAAYKYRTKLKNLAIIDSAHNQTTKAAIYLNNKAGHLAFTDLSDLYIEDTWNGIACAPTLDANTNYLHTCTWEKIHLEIVRNYSLFINNAIDMRARNIFISIPAITAVPAVRVQAPVELSAGSYFTDITILDNAKAGTTNDGLSMDKIHETFWTNLIVDGVGDDGVVLNDSSRNRFTNLFILSCTSDGLVMTGDSDHNIYTNPIIESSGAFGVVNNTTGAANYMVNAFMELNVSGNFSIPAGTLRYSLVTEMPVIARGTSTGTGAQQTIAHTLVGITPTYVWFSDIEDGANAYQSAPADATNIYVTAVAGKDYAWKAEY